MSDQLKRYVVQRDDDRPIRFAGTVLADVANSPDKASGNYSGATGLSYSYTLYRTARGKYVCARVGYTQWQDQHDRYTAEACDTIEQIVDFFGHDRLAKRLYAEAGLDVAEEIA